METESGAKIAIRGKGSVKEGKGRSDAAHTSNQDEDLHCLILADTEDKINKAKKLIHNVIETAASIPEGQNELKRNQLRELAALNGTLRDDENQACQNCGEIGHRRYDCPSQRNVTSNIICRVCGNAGHMARDCPDRKLGSDWRDDQLPPRARIGGAPDGDLEGLMQELGGGNGPPARLEAGPTGGDFGRDNYRQGGAKPWERGPTGAPAPWSQGGGGHDGGNMGAGGPAPWNNRPPRDNYGGYGGAPSGGPAPWNNRPPRDNYGGGGGGAVQPPPPPPPADDLPPPPPPADDDAPPPPPPA